ncbi:MAG: hypothetical protein K2X84_18030 [Beijerinckiaceae bacterium]|nr:hypothetical protein [Beijerinckiaceae bacterium]
MNRMAALRRRRLEAQAQLLKAEASPKRKGRRAARRRFILATAEILRAEINNRIAAPLLRARARQDRTADLFSQMGA